MLIFGRGAEGNLPAFGFVHLCMRFFTRRVWKEFGLGGLNFLLVAVSVVVAQIWLSKHGGQAVAAAVGTIICVAAYLAGTKWIERRSPTEFAPNRSVPESLTGLLIGVLLFSAVVTVLWATGNFNFLSWGGSGQLASGLLFAVSAGVVEEVLFRGLLFRLSAKIVGTWGALLVTAALFGAAHGANPGATISSSLAIALEAGILLGAAYASTRRLWLPIGLHIGWNFTEGSVFGLSVSGFGSKGGVIRGSLTGPQILTGGAFGAEASIVAVIVCLVVAAFFLRQVLQRGLLEPPVWSARAGLLSEPQKPQTTFHEVRGGDSGAP